MVTPPAEYWFMANNPRPKHFKFLRQNSGPWNKSGINDPYLLLFFFGHKDIFALSWLLYHGYELNA